MIIGFLSESPAKVVFKSVMVNNALFADCPVCGCFCETSWWGNIRANRLITCILFLRISCFPLVSMCFPQLWLHGSRETCPSIVPGNLSSRQTKWPLFPEKDYLENKIRLLFVRHRRYCLPFPSARRCARATTLSIEPGSACLYIRPE